VIEVMMIEREIKFRLPEGATPNPSARPSSR